MINVSVSVRGAPTTIPTVRLAAIRHDHHPAVYGVCRLERDPWYYALVLHDPPIAGENPNADMGAPETVRARNADDKILLTESVQWWLFWLFYRNAPELWKDEYNAARAQGKDTVETSWLLKKFYAYLGGTIAFTNFGGSQNRACYPCHTNLDAEPISTIGAWCGGATVELATGPTTYRGEPVYGIQAVNVFKPLPVVSSMPDTSVFFATITRRQPPASGNLSERKVIGFPHLGGNSCPMAGFMNSDIALIEANRIEPLPEGAPIQNPYNL